MQVTLVLPYRRKVAVVCRRYRRETGILRYLLEWYDFERQIWKAWRWVTMETEAQVWVWEVDESFSW